MRSAADLRRLRAAPRRAVLLSAVVLSACVLPGCGGGSGATGPGHRSAGRGSGAGGVGYRWLIATQGAPPTIAAENRQPGTSAGRLPGPRALLGGAAHGPVAAYVASQSVLAGG